MKQIRICACCGKDINWLQSLCFNNCCSYKCNILMEQGNVDVTKNTINKNNEIISKSNIIVNNQDKNKFLMGENFPEKAELFDTSEDDSAIILRDMAFCEAIKRKSVDKSVDKSNAESESSNINSNDNGNYSSNYINVDDNHEEQEDIQKDEYEFEDDYPEENGQETEYKPFENEECLNNYDNGIYNENDVDRFYSGDTEGEYENNY